MNIAKHLCFEWQNRFAAILISFRSLSSTTFKYTDGLLLNLTNLLTEQVYPYVHAMYKSDCILSLKTKSFCNVQVVWKYFHDEKWLEKILKEKNNQKNPQTKTQQPTYTRVFCA